MRMCYSLAAVVVLSLVLPSPAAEAVPATKEIREAVVKALPLVRKGSAGHRAQRTCFACHHQALPILAVTTARTRGIAADEEDLLKHLQFIADFLGRHREEYLKGRGQGGQADTAGYALWTLEMGGWKADQTTAAVAEYLLLRDKDRDHWRVSGDRPPSEASRFTTTYLALRGLQMFGTTEQKARIKERVKKVRGWLEKTPAKDTEDAVFRLWAMKRAGCDAADVRAAADHLLKEQRPDGGWAQRDTMESDAYATGTALTALHQAAGLATTDPVYQRGIKRLLATQREDGSWHVRSRSKPFQTYFESGFPHGKDQFISLAASGWATTALALALPQPKDAKNSPSRTDHYGDPLPAGALFRIGVNRFRHSNTIVAVCYAPDGKTLAGLGHEGVRLWDASTGKELYRHGPFNHYDRGFFSPDGRRLWLQSGVFGQSSRENTISVWDLFPMPKRQPEKAPFDGRNLMLLAASPNGKVLAVGDNGDIRLCDTTTGKEIRRLRSSTYQARFSADGKILASFAGDSIALWDVQTGQQIRAFRSSGRLNSFRRFALAADGKTVAALSDSSKISIRLFDTGTGEEKQNLQLSAPAPRDMTFSPDGKILALVAQNSLHAWEVSSGKMLWEHRPPSGQFFCATFSPDSKTLAVGVIGEVRRYDAATGRQVPPPGDGEPITFVRPLADGRTVATAAPEKPLCLRRLPSGEELSPAPGQKRPAVPEVADVSPDGKWMTSRSHSDRAIRIWDIASGEVLHLLPHVRPSGGSFSPDGKWVETHDYVTNPRSGGYEFLLRFWDARTGKLVSERRDEQSSLARFSPDSRLYVTHGKVCCLGSVPDGSIVRQIPLRHIGYTFAFSPDGRLLAGASWRDEPPSLWEVVSGKQITTFTDVANKGPDRPIFSSYEIAFSPDGHTMITGGQAGALFCWDVEGRLVRQLKGDNFSSHRLLFTPEGKLLISQQGCSAVGWDLAAALPVEDRRPLSLTAAELDGLWSDLKADDATKAYRAVWRLEAAPGQAVAFLSEHLRPAREPDRTNIERIVAAIDELDSDTFAVREKAGRDLAMFGREAEPALRKALARDLSPESKRRIEELVSKLPDSWPAPPAELLRQLRALAVLEHAATPEARKCLQALAGGNAEARLTREAKATLERLTRRAAR